VGFIAVSIAMVTGGLLGAVSGYYGGKLDNLIMRVMDVLLSIPQILLAIAIAASLGPGLFNLMIAVGISSIPGYARIVRGSVLSIRNQEFVEAARAMGSGDLRIILRHILPNCMAPVIVQATLGVAFAILTAAGLSFIGLGIQPPSPEWGAMLSGGRVYIRDHSYMTFFPGLAIMITILALNFLGDGLRDALDPKLKR
jgi:peptide/nickel transport system permease protein